GQYKGAEGSGARHYREARDQGGQPRSARRATERRQPAEGGARPMAAARPAGPAAGRADSRGRDRCAQRDPPADPPAGGGGHGSNQQTVVLRRWLQRAPQVLLLDEPTRGVDINARSEIHKLIRRLAAEGMAVLVVSSEPDELPDLCDRVLVMAEGRLVREFAAGALSREAIIEARYSAPTTAMKESLHGWLVRDRRPAGAPRPGPARRLRALCAHSRPRGDGHCLLAADAPRLSDSVELHQRPQSGILGHDHCRRP